MGKPAKSERPDPPERRPALGNVGQAGHKVAALSGPFRAESHAPGAVIYHVGDPADRVYLVKGGHVRLMRVGPRNRRELLTLLREGDLFGELLGPEGAVMEDMAVAVGPTQVWSIGSREFRALLEGRPGLALDIVRALNDRVRRMRRRLLGLTFKEVPARLAELLLLFGELHGERCQHGGELDLRVLTQQDLADLLGASRSFVSTLINGMKRDGLLGNAGRTLCLRDRQGLARIAAKER